MKNQYFLFLGGLCLALLGVFACQNSNSTTSVKAMQSFNFIRAYAVEISTQMGCTLSHRVLEEKNEAAPLRAEYIPEKVAEDANLVQALLLFLPMPDKEKFIVLELKPAEHKSAFVEIMNIDWQASTGQGSIEIKHNAGLQHKLYFTPFSEPVLSPLNCTTETGTYDQTIETEDWLLYPLEAKLDLKTPAQNSTTKLDIGLSSFVNEEWNTIAQCWDVLARLQQSFKTSDKLFHWEVQSDGTIQGLRNKLLPLSENVSIDFRIAGQIQNISGSHNFPSQLQQVVWLKYGKEDAQAVEVRIRK